jgi:hypothetical protein
MKKILYIIGALLFIKGVHFSFIELVDRGLLLDKKPLLPQAVLTKERKYIKAKLDKLGYDYILVSSADLTSGDFQEGYGILQLTVLKGKCSVVDDKILKYDDPNIYQEAFAQPACNEVDK